MDYKNIICSIIIFVLAGIIVFGGINQIGKDIAYKKDIADLERERNEFQDTIIELRKDITGLEKQQSEFEKTIGENGEIIRRLENENNSFRKNITGFDENLKELEKLLTEFLVD